MKYMVRWTIDPKKKGWVKAKANEEVTLIQRVTTKEWGYGTPCVKTRKDTGLIPPIYLKDYDVDEVIAGKTAQKKPSKKHKKNPSIDDGRWWLGNVGPLEAADALRDASLSVGTFVVCSPPELRRVRTYAPLLLLIRTFSGSEEKQHEDWQRLQERKKIQLAETAAQINEGKPIAEEETPKGSGDIIHRSDSLPGGCAPFPLVAYFLIRRNERNGTYYINKEDGYHSTVHDLLYGYHGKSLHVDGVAVSLRLPPPLTPKTKGPVPPAFPAPCCHLDMEKRHTLADPLPTSTEVQKERPIEIGYYGCSELGTPLPSVTSSQLYSVF